MRAEKTDSRTRRRQIAEAALGIIARRGMKGLSVAAVAEKVGLVPSALYRHYQGKEEILRAVVELIRDLIRANLRLVRREHPLPLEQLKGLMIRHLQMIQDFQAIPRIIFSEELADSRRGGRTAVYRIVQGFLKEVAGMITCGQRTGYIRSDLDPEVLAVIFLGFLQPPAILWYLSRGRFNIQGHMEKAWPFFERTVRGRGRISEETAEAENPCLPLGPLDPLNPANPSGPINPEIPQTPFGPIQKQAQRPNRRGGRNS